jgi:hypothetical protein
MPEFYANVILGYDFKGFSFRVSYFYRNGYSVLDNYMNILQAKEDNYRRLDIALRQEILNNFYVILNLNNITDSEEEVLVGNVPNQYEPAVTWKTNQAFRNGFNVNFGIGMNL